MISGLAVYAGYTGPLDVMIMLVGYAGYDGWLHMMADWLWLLCCLFSYALC
jgi:hypothetical protein